MIKRAHVWVLARIQILALTITRSQRDFDFII